MLALLSLPVPLLVALGGPAAAAPAHGAAVHAAAVTRQGLGTFKPTFTGPASTGCASGCNLLTGPFTTTSKVVTGSAGHAPDLAKAVPLRRPALPTGVHSNQVTIPTVNCSPTQGPGCDTISTSAGGAVSVKGINAVDSATHTTNKFKDVEPPDQGLCAGNGSVIEANNIGEMLVFNAALNRTSPVISLDSVMGLTSRNWSSGGDPACLWDPANGGHWFITEFVSASPESKGGPFAGCFAAVANTCYEGIAVSKGTNPLGPYNTYYLNANYNPAEPGTPYLLNDYTKIGATRDAFMLFYDAFALRGGGIGGGGFNGAQQYAFGKNAMEMGMPSSKVNVAIENMGTIPTPYGTCASDNRYHEPSVACWFSVIPAAPPSASQYDNAHGGSGFMLATLDFYSTGSNQLAVFYWTGLKKLNSPNCTGCSGSGGIRFGGQMFNGVDASYDNNSLPSGLLAAQKAGPIPLGDECGKAGLASVAHCPEGGIATNSDQVTQASQGNGQLWTGVNTAVVQENAGGTSEQHMGAVYYVVGTAGFNQSVAGLPGPLSLTSQGYISANHEDLEFPAIAAGAPGGKAIVSFTLNGNGGPGGADSGGYYPSSAYGHLTTTSAGLVGSTINIAAMGQSPQDGFTEYQGYPGPIRPRWGDYGAAVLMGSKAYFASEYIQYPNCAPPQFQYNAIGTCGGTRDGNANWGTSVNYVTP